MPRCSSAAGSRARRSSSSPASSRTRAGVAARRYGGDGGGVVRRRPDFFAIGRRASDWRLVQRLKTNPVYARALTFLERYPIGFIFAFRWMPGFRTISPLAIGTSSVSARLFLVVNAVAAVVWASTFTLIGYVFGREAERVLGRIEPSPTAIAIAVAVVVAFGLAIHFGLRWWRSRRDRLD